MDVVPFAKYLGCILGPGATIDDVWPEAGAKWIHRVRDLAHEGAPVHTTTVIYNSRVLTVLSYLMQLLPLPRAL
eukprot:2382568-Pyramimonas_sp.AAC.1